MTDIDGHTGTYRGWPTAPPLIVITPMLAKALDALISVAHAECEQLAPDDPLVQAVNEVRALHNFEGVRLGGEPL